MSPVRAFGAMPEMSRLKQITIGILLTLSGAFLLDINATPVTGFLALFLGLCILVEGVINERPNHD